MVVVFCVYGFAPENELLQPWLTVREVARALLASGFEVHLVTDVDRRPSLEGMQHHYVKSMRPSNAGEIRSLLHQIRPDRVVVLATPLNLAFSGWYKYVQCKLIAFLSYPFYTYSELFRALPHLDAEATVTYGRHALVPKLLWAATLRKYYSAVIAQSQTTALRVASAAGGSVVAHDLRAGLDLAFWAPAETKVRQVRRITRFLYVGSAKAIRGFDVLLGAFQRLEGQAVELRILARGSTPEEVGVLRKKIEGKLAGMGRFVEIIGGWVEREQYRDELRAADVVVLPFVLVPSELPVSVIECIACGTPVIATDIDGLPDAVGAAGMIVRSGSIKALARAMQDIVNDPAQLANLREHCIEARREMLDWGAVGHQWLKVLST